MKGIVSRKGRRSRRKSDGLIEVPQVVRCVFCVIKAPRTSTWAYLSFPCFFPSPLLFPQFL